MTPITYIIRIIITIVISTSFLSTSKAQSPSMISATIPNQEYKVATPKNQNFQAVANFNQKTNEISLAGPSRNHLEGKAKGQNATNYMNRIFSRFAGKKKVNKNTAALALASNAGESNKK